jgi:hypothetical protein
MNSFTIVLVLFSGMVIATLGCGEEETPLSESPMLQFEFLSGWIYGDLMPPVRPDPIEASLNVEVTNLTEDNLYELTIPSAEVILAESGENLGKIDFATTWDGHLGPQEVDTVTVNKIDSGIELFYPPCEEDIILEISVHYGGVEISIFASDTILFECGS